jgi:transcriptional regulator with XRE-family HTH domain
VKQNKGNIVFCSNLSRLRAQARLTQEQLAEKSGLHWRYLQKLERPQANPSLKVLYGLKKALLCSWNDLLGNGP